MYKIMVIEDDEKITSLLKDRLERYEYLVVSVKDYSNIKSEFINENPHLLLLDINLPYYDGFFWCREIRTISKVPIIFISARFTDMDQVMAIDNGGDDYIIKPFSFDLLFAKIKGILRRAYGEYSENDTNDIYEIDGLFLHKSKNTVEWQEQKVELSKKEFGLLQLLLSNINGIIPRETLLEELWDDLNFVDDNTLSVNMTRLRKRLEDIGIVDSIQTKRGLGYTMVNTWSKKV